MDRFSKIIQNAKDNLPFDKKSKPWKYVNHGVGLLNTRDELNCYLAAYGEMHHEKIRIAISSIDGLSDILEEKYQIIDWGCGQGLATLCFLDFLKENNVSFNPEKIILIEPSQPALDRASTFIEKAGISESRLLKINKYLNDIDSDDIKSSSSVTLNFFSNILDIKTVDIERIADVVKNNLVGNQYFFCVGPLNRNSTRIGKFAKNLNFTEKEIINRESGKLKKTRGTIKLLVFKAEGTQLEIIKSIYYPPMPNNQNYEYILQNLLNDVSPNNLGEVERIIEYYKLIVELEQHKEPMIDNYYQYKYELSNSNEFHVDLGNNEKFLTIFNENRDPDTSFPKDLNIAIRVESENKKHAVLKYIYLYNDIKDINPAEEKVRIKLSDFEVNYPTLTKFGKNEKEIDEIEELVKSQETLQNVIEVIKEKLDSNLTFDKNLSLALSSKNAALSQIHSELKKVKKHNISTNSLLGKFLFNQPFSNEVKNKLTENNLIQITQLDNKQKDAVLSSFNNKVSVITGPPGSGKTQVISNILANAVLQEKKVLVASKNNKAVDNVKDRFGEEDENGFFLRFGSKNYVRTETKPEIDRIINVINDLEDNEDDFNRSKKNLKETKQTKQSCIDRLNRRDELIDKIPHLKQNVEDSIESMGLKQDTDNIIKGISKYNIQQFDDLNSQLKSSKNEIQLKYSGLRKIWFNWFNKKRYALEFIKTIDQYSLEIRNYLDSINIPKQITSFKNGDDIIEGYQKVIDAFNNSIEYLNATLKLEDCQNIINQINGEELQLKAKIKQCDQGIIQLSKRVLDEKIKNKLFNSQIANINNYKNYIPDSIPWKMEEIPEFIDATKKFLSIFNINSVTSLSAKSAYPLTDNLFDIVVIDEASQCDIASAIPLILRAKQIVIIGDPLQLKHITNLEDYEEVKIKEHLNLTSSVHLQYKNKSLWDYSKDFLSHGDNNETPVNITGHYRCHPDIIGYSNEAFYIPKLNAALEVHTNPQQFKIEPKGMHWINVEGKQRANNVNVNDAEVEKSIELATQLAIEHTDISIGIVTPFRHQADELNKRLPNEITDRVLASTVHKFQGDEKDVMIYSMVVTNNSPDSKIKWIDNYVPYLVNVAVTRAKNTLYIIGNKEYIRKKSQFPQPLFRLVKYVEGLENRNH